MLGRICQYLSSLWLTDELRCPGIKAILEEHDSALFSHLSVQLHRRQPLQLVADKVGVVRGGDVVARERLVEVLLHAVAEVDGRVGAVHQVAGEALEAQLRLRPQGRVRFVDLKGGLVSVSGWPLFSLVLSVPM